MPLDETLHLGLEFVDEGSLVGRLTQPGSDPGWSRWLRRHGATLATLGPKGAALAHGSPVAPFVRRPEPGVVASVGS